MVEESLSKENDEPRGVVGGFEEPSEGGGGEIVDVGEGTGSEGRVNGRRRCDEIGEGGKVEEDDVGRDGGLQRKRERGRRVVSIEVERKDASRKERRATHESSLTPTELEIQPRARPLRMSRLPPRHTDWHPSSPGPIQLPSEIPNERSREKNEGSEDEVNSLTLPERGRDEEEDDSNEGVDGVGGDGNSSRVAASVPVVTRKEDGGVEEKIGELTEEEPKDGSRVGIDGMSEERIWERGKAG